MSEIKSLTIARIEEADSKKKFELFFRTDDIELLETCPNDVSLTLKFVTEVLTCTSEVSFKESMLNYLFVGKKGISAHCSVIWGILGARFGHSSLPQEWLNLLPEKNRSWLNAKLNHLLDLFGLP